MFMSGLLALKALPDLAPFCFLLASVPGFFLAWIPLRVVSFILPPKLFGAADDYMWGSYQKFVLLWFEKLSPVEVLFYGDIDEVREERQSVLYICNHQSTFDWIVADMVAARQGSSGHTRFILKDGLRFLPLYGYYFYQHDCIYVRRGRKFDSERMTKYLRQIPKRRAFTWLVLFPEGTRFNPDNLEAIANSQNHAKAAGIAPLENVLMPRYKAFQQSLSSLRDYFDAVYDVTILYSQTRHAPLDANKQPTVVHRSPAPTMNEYMHGVGQKLHIIVRRFKVAEIPVEEKQVEAWLYGIFEEKDRVIGKFYKQGTLPGCGQSVGLRWLEVIPAAMVLTAWNAFLLATPCGRKVYLSSVLGGTLITAAWMAIAKAA